MGVLSTIGRSLAEGGWMLYDTLWALVLGFALSGAVQAFVSKNEMQKALGDHRPATIARASFFGMVSSSCSYAASALAKSLFSRGADFTSSMIFMFAGTNLVIELGIVMWLLLGWQFAAAEFVGGFLMIVMLAVVLPRVVNVVELDAARARLRQGTAGDGDHPGNDGHADMSEPSSATPWRKRVSTRAGWADASGYTISDFTMLRKELLVGYVIAGFASMAVPTSVWRALFLTGHGFASTLENVIVGPVLAFISFVCSVGNVPLGAALWKGGISFGGVIAFIFADLLALPLVLIYRKFYGTRLAVKLSLVFWAVMSLAGLLTELLFQAFGAIPMTLRGDIATTHLGLNYTTVLNVLALLAIGYLYYLYKNAEKFGGGTGYAKDVVCGMQVRTADAPARQTYAGTAFFFCADKCQHKFNADPGKYATGQATEPMQPAATPGRLQEGVDPVCGMQVEGATAAAHVDHHGRQVSFCSTGCADAFRSDSGRYVTEASINTRDQPVAPDAEAHAVGQTR